MSKKETDTTAEDSRFGQRIRQRRQGLGLTLRQLAKKTDLTASFLSQVERGQTKPSIDSLRRIASALGLSILNFLEEAPRPDPVVRADSRPKLTLAGSEVSYELLVPNLSRRMEVFIGRVAPSSGNIARSPLREPTEECIYVLSGELKVGLSSGDHVLRCGDSIYFEGAELREISNASPREETRWISIITPPVF